MSKLPWILIEILSCTNVRSSMISLKSGFSNSAFIDSIVLFDVLFLYSLAITIIQILI